jgi:RNA polymerase sigma-70 factor (ECF subfamily)
VEPAGSAVAAFATTHWSLVLAAGHGSSVEALSALEQLARTYQFPVYAEARRRGHDHHAALDLTQGFFAELLAGTFFARADSAKGRFRSYLLTALNHFLADDWRRRTRQIRGGGVASISLDDDALGERYRIELQDARDPSWVYDRRFALSLLDATLRDLEREFASFGSAPLFQQLQVFLTGEDEDAPAYAELGPRLGLTEGAVKSAVYRLRRRYRELLRVQVSRVVATPEEVEDELRHIFHVLSSY